MISRVIQNLILMITKAKDLAKNTINNAIDGLFGNKRRKKEKAPDIEQKMFPTSRKLMLG